MADQQLATIPSAPNAPLVVVKEPTPGNQAVIALQPTLHIEYTREGNFLIGHGYVINGGKIEVLKSAIDLVALKNSLMLDPTVAGLEFMGDGFFESLAKTVVSIGKSTIVKSLVNGAKSILQSKELGVAMTGLAFVCPPIGIPAAGAYAAGNQALKYIDQGNEAIKAGEKLLKSGKGLTAVDKMKIRNAIAKKKLAQDKLKKIAAMAKAKVHDAEKARKIHAAVVKENAKLKAQGSDRILLPPVSPHQYAQVIGMVHKSRMAIKAIHASLDIPLKLNMNPRILTKYPIGPNDPVRVFYKKYLASHPKSSKHRPGSKTSVRHNTKHAA